MYLRALRTIPELEIILGQFSQHTVTMPLAATNPQKFAAVIRTDEKGSDVNIAAHLLHDGHRGLYEAAILISDDSDLATPLRMVRGDLGLVTGVLTSKKRPSLSLHHHASFYKRIRPGVLAASQFPSTLRDATGTFHKPPSW